MSGSPWQDGWRSVEPRPDFARRVVLELEREQRWGAPAVGQRRAALTRRWSPWGLWGLAALLLSGAAAASLAVGRPPVLGHSTVEQAPTQKAWNGSPRLHFAAQRAPMEPEVERPRPPRVAPVPAVPTPSARDSAPAPLHFPACHCSSSAIVCSCVD